MDAAARVVVEAAIAHGYSVSVIADHGNADRMRNLDGSPHTAHTTALVPHLIVREGFDGPIRDGKLGDVAPTILAILDEPIPEEMTGEALAQGAGRSPTYSLSTNLLTICYPAARSRCFC